MPFRRARESETPELAPAAKPPAPGEIAAGASEPLLSPFGTRSPTVPPVPVLHLAFSTVFVFVFACIWTKAKYRLYLLYLEPPWLCFLSGEMGKYYNSAGAGACKLHCK